MTSSTSISVPTQKRRARWIIAGILVFAVLAALLLPLISLVRYHRTIADSLSRSVGHTVRLRSVNLAIFPLPGLVIHDLTVEEDPAFGAEPLLRAPQVIVFLRFSSLWNQRLEVSRINLENASVNLARDPSGHWNLASLLLQASRTNTAPTAQRHASAAPRFPYIEFSTARINFKEGAEKKAFSFLNADASVWLADPDQWRIRFAAQPARTDLDPDLADTGTIRLEGSLTRAASLEELPLNLHAEWSGAQLGQVSRLMLGSDSGWRGNLLFQANVTGDIDNLALTTRLRVTNAHRIEFTPLNPVNVDARCQASYYHPAQLFDNLTCLWPTGDGHLLLTGSIQSLYNPQPRLKLEINHTPVPFATAILGLLRSTISSALTASGTINGQFTWAPKISNEKSSQTENILTGHATAENVAIRLAGTDQPITFAALRFTTPSEELPAQPEHPSHTRLARTRSRNKPSRLPQVLDFENLGGMPISWPSNPPTSTPEPPPPCRFPDNSPAPDSSSTSPAKAPSRGSSQSPATSARFTPCPPSPSPKAPPNPTSHSPAHGSQPSTSKPASTLPQPSKAGHASSTPSSNPTGSPSRSRSPPQPPSLEISPAPIPLPPTQ